MFGNRKRPGHLSWSFSISMRIGAYLICALKLFNEYSLIDST